MAAPYVYPYMHIYTRMQRWVCNRTHQHFVVLSTLTLYSLLYPGFFALRREYFSIFQNHQVCESASLRCARLPSSEFPAPAWGVEMLRSEAGREGRATTAPFSGGNTTESQKGQQQQHYPHSKAFIEVMSNDIAEIEEAKIPGNYSARKIQRWNPSSIYATNIEHKEPPPSNDDAIHENIPADHVAPAQMYSTDSGKLFHAGSICLIMVGLPGRGKTNLSISLCRYLRWLGVRTKLFHLGDYRRKNTDFKGDSGLNFEKLLSTSYFTSSPDNIDIKLLKLKIKNELISDIITYFHTSNGQIAIYDAINGVPSEREELLNYFKAKNIRCLFIESIVDDMDLLSGNIRDSVNSPDYSGWDSETALDNFKKRIMISEKYYENLDSHSKLPFIQSFNFGEKMLINELKHDFLTTKIVYYLLNARIKSHSIYFARCSLNKLKFKDDPPITESGKEYINKIYKTLAADFPDGKIPKELVVWTSTRLRTIQSSELFKHARCVVRHRPELTQLNPGAAEGLTDDELNKKYHADYLKHKADPYHHRYPRAESYHDLALKIEPLILEMEKLSEDILVIADETVIRIFYGYLMAANANDIPQIEFPQNEIIKITYHTYNNEIKRLVVEGIESE